MLGISCIFRDLRNSINMYEWQGGIISSKLQYYTLSNFKGLIKHTYNN